MPTTRAPAKAPALSLLLLVWALHWPSLAHAAEAEIKRALAERLPSTTIDEVVRTPVRGLFEVRIGTSIFYTDETGRYLINGQVIDTKTKTNITQVRLDKLNQIDTTTLNLNDAIVWKQGTGHRKLIVFADPNCGYCKHLEADLQHLKDITIYTYLYPILGGDSPQKAKNIWCAKDRTDAWRQWMLAGVAPPSSGPCNSTAIERNVALGKKHQLNGTPSLIFQDGSSVPGALPFAELEQRLLADGKPH